jgi:hypothetical protein
MSYFDQKLAWALSSHHKPEGKEWDRCNKDFVYCGVHRKLALAGKNTSPDPKCGLCSVRDEMTALLSSDLPIEKARVAWRLEFDKYDKEKITTEMERKMRLAWIRYDIAAYNLGEKARNMLSVPLDDALKKHMQDSRQRNGGHTLYAFCMTHNTLGDMYPHAKDRTRYDKRCGCCKKPVQEEADRTERIYK